MSIGAHPGRKPWGGKTAERGRRCKPSLEMLEDRCLLSAGFTQINLDSDVAGLARTTDPNLVNPWGIAYSPTGAFWFGDNHTGVSDIVDGNGNIVPLVVRVPSAGGSVGSPTGTVYNGSAGFQITENGISGPAKFLFASEDGTISAWNPQVDDYNAHLVIDNSQQGADYKGLALATGPDGHTYLYAANFSQGKIDVFDSSFQPVSTRGSFSDPNLPAGFAPFNVQTINGELFVTYAKIQPGGTDDVAGAGNGFIDVYTPSGNLVERLASGGPLNSPWGMTVAPQSFGSFSGALLVGNTGDGHINAYDLSSGAYLGQLKDTNGNPLAISGLWGLIVGNDHLGGNSQTVFFAAGIDHEQHGLFGAIQNSQGGQSGTAGTLPYDPNSDGDDYPLPPTQGPSLGSDSVQAAPTPVLLSVSNSSFALAPTLSISPQFPRSEVSASASPVLVSNEPESTVNSTNPVVVIGTITGPGSLSAFSLTSPIVSISTNQSACGTSEFDGNNTRSEAFSLYLLLLHDDTPAASVEDAESKVLLTSSAFDSEWVQLREELMTDARLSDSIGNVAKEFPFKSIGEEIESFSAQDNRLQLVGGVVVLRRERHSRTEPATPTEAENGPPKPLYVRILHGVCLAVVTCLPWNPYRVSENSASKNLRGLRKSR